MSPRVLFVAGAHTDIGKTHVGCGLLRAAREQGWAVDALKPVVSGFDEQDWDDSDPGRLLGAAARPLTGENLDAISPWRFAAPLAPPTAAGMEARALAFGPVIDFCRRRTAASRADLILVEGVGGLMSPIADGATSLDLLEALACRSVLVGGSYLGAISHTLTALEVMRARDLAPGVLLISQSADPSAPDFGTSVALVAEHTGKTPVIPVWRGEGPDWAQLVLNAVPG